MDNRKKFYENASMEGGFSKRKFAILEKLIEKNSLVLDLGCYDGRVGDFLTKNLSCIVDGVDIIDCINKNFCCYFSIRVYRARRGLSLSDNDSLQ